LGRNLPTSALFNLQAMNAGRHGPVIIEVALETLTGAVLLASSFRLVSVPFLFLFAMVRAVRWPRSGRLAVCLGVLFIVSVVQPVDISLGGRYTFFGTPGRGLRFVPVVFGLPNHVYLRERYIEYACGGCSAPIIEPKWILKWN
jgi:hypothetical protein